MQHTYASGETPRTGDRIHLADGTGLDRTVDSIGVDGLLNVRMPDGPVAYRIHPAGYLLRRRDEPLDLTIARARHAQLRADLAPEPTGVALAHRLDEAA